MSGLSREIASDTHAIIDEIIYSRLKKERRRIKVLNFANQRGLASQVCLVFAAWLRVKRAGDLLIIREYSNRLLLSLLFLPFIGRGSKLVVNHNLSVGFFGVLLHVVASRLGFQFLLIDGRPLVPLFTTFGMNIQSITSSDGQAIIGLKGKSFLVLGVSTDQSSLFRAWFSRFAPSKFVFGGRDGQELNLCTREQYLSALKSHDVICFFPRQHSYCARNSGTLWDAMKLNKWIFTWDLPVFNEQVKGYERAVLVRDDIREAGVSK